MCFVQFQITSIQNYTCNTFNKALGFIYSMHTTKLIFQVENLHCNKDRVKYYSNYTQKFYIFAIYFIVTELIYTFGSKLFITFLLKIRVIQFKHFFFSNAGRLIR